ncbi:MAG: FmdE family protein [Anaerolineae bacterium]
MANSHTLPDWAVAFHTHRCPYLAIGFRMGNLAMEALHFDRSHNRGLLVLPEFGEGTPYTCIMTASGPPPARFTARS